MTGAVISRGQVDRILLDMFLGVKLLGHTASLCLTFQQISKLFSKVASVIYEVSTFPSSSLTPNVVFLFEYTYFKV